jgi:hypothetical protein
MNDESSKEFDQITELGKARSDEYTRTARHLSFDFSPIRRVVALAHQEHIEILNALLSYCPMAFSSLIPW